jgi:hypothetical protein
MFGSTLVLSKVDPDTVPDGALVIEQSGDCPKWLHFRCPCGCGETRSVNLMRSHSPAWALITHENGRCSLSPSVVVNRGCHSHFWIRDNRVIWCS